MTKEARKKLLEKLASGFVELTDPEELVEAERLSKLGLVTGKDFGSKMGPDFEYKLTDGAGKAYYLSGKWEKDTSVGRQVLKYKTPAWTLFVAIVSATILALGQFICKKIENKNGKPIPNKSANHIEYDSANKVSKQPL